MAVDDLGVKAGSAGRDALRDSDLPVSSILDTNVLVSSTASRRKLHEIARNVVQWPISGKHACVSGQILREYLVVATRPLESNGLCLTPAEAAANVSAFRSLVHCLRFGQFVEVVPLASIA